MLGCQELRPCAAVLPMLTQEHAQWLPGGMIPDPDVDMSK